MCPDGDGYKGGPVSQMTLTSQSERCLPARLEHKGPPPLPPNRLTIGACVYPDSGPSSLGVDSKKLSLCLTVVSQPVNSLLRRNKDPGEHSRPATVICSQFRCCTACAQVKAAAGHTWAWETQPEPRFSIIYVTTHPQQNYIIGKTFKKHRVEMRQN